MIDESLELLGVDEALRKDTDLRLEALQFAIERGGRSGRVATQFARIVAGREELKRIAAQKADK